MAFCENCGTSLRAGARFCSACGAVAASGRAASKVAADARQTPPSWPCPSCGSANAAAAGFCTHCGSALGAHGRADVAAERPTLPIAPAAIARGPAVPVNRRSTSSHRAARRRLIIALAVAVVLVLAAAAFAVVTRKEGEPAATHSRSATAVAMGTTQDFRCVVLRSEDGGLTWKQTTLGVTPLDTVAFGDSRHGLAAGLQLGSTRTPLIATDDGGKTWAERDSATSHDIAAIIFANPARVLAAGNGGIRVSTDGGRTWTATADEPNDYVVDVAFADARHAVALGRGGGVYYSSDSGETWMAVESGVGADTMLSSVAFGDAQHGVAAGRDLSADTSVLLTTADGGQTWTQADAVSQAICRVAFADAQHAVAVGDSVILISADAGQTWTPSAYQTSATLIDVAFADSKHGIAVGLDPNLFHAVILVTADAGRTWTSRRWDSASALGLGSVAFVPSE